MINEGALFHFNPEQIVSTWTWLPAKNNSDLGKNSPIHLIPKTPEDFPSLCPRNRAVEVQSKDSFIYKSLKIDPKTVEKTVAFTREKGRLFSKLTQEGVGTELKYRISLYYKIPLEERKGAVDSCWIAHIDLPHATQYAVKVTLLSTDNLQEMNQDLNSPWAERDRENLISWISYYVHQVSLQSKLKWYLSTDIADNRVKLAYFAPSTKEAIEYLFAEYKGPRGPLSLLDAEIYVSSQEPPTEKPSSTCLIC